MQELKDVDKPMDGKWISFIEVFPLAIRKTKMFKVVNKDNQIEIRTGKHELNNVVKLNKKNPAIFKQTFSNVDSKNNPISETLLVSNKINIAVQVQLNPHIFL